MPNPKLAFARCRQRTCLFGWRASYQILVQVWFNVHAKQKGIRFVVVTGVLTDSGEKSEFDKVNEILSTLTVPFVPQIGNHDVGSHTNIGMA